MGVKITDIIGEFPTNDEYQIVDVTQISQKGIIKSLKVIFQRLYAGEFEVHTKYIDVSYARLIVIGTIWRNKHKVKLPVFLEKYQAFNLDFSKLKISKSVTSSVGRDLKSRPVYREAFLVENFFVYMHHKSNTCRSGGLNRYFLNTLLPADFPQFLIN